MKMQYLLLDLIFSSEHIVNVSEVVGAREEVIDLALRLVVLLQVGTLTEVAHLESGQLQ